jgi:hypothetical protein
MKIAISNILFIMAVALTASCNKTYVGEGEPMSIVRETGKFDKVVLNMDAIVRLTDTTVNSCVVTAQGNIQEAIITRLDGNTLVITSKGNLITDYPVEIAIGISQAAAVEVNGSGEMTGTNTLKNEELDFEVNGSGVLRLDVVAVKLTGAVSGSGEVFLTGSSNEFNVEINGSGSVNAKEFSTLRSKVRISGSGEVKLFAEESLEANVSGSGVVRYRGNAAVDKKISGSGEVIKID